MTTPWLPETVRADKPGDRMDVRRAKEAFEELVLLGLGSLGADDTLGRARETSAHLRLGNIIQARVQSL